MRAWANPTYSSTDTHQVRFDRLEKGPDGDYWPSPFKDLRATSTCVLEAAQQK